MLHGLDTHNVENNLQQVVLRRTNHLLSFETTLTAKKMTPQTSPLCRRNVLTEQLPDNDRDIESELLYEWRFTANQLVLTPSPLRITT
jgi:hypothetical protein